MGSKSRERARLAVAAATVTALCVGGVSLAQGGGTAQTSAAADITTGSVTHNWTVVRGRTKATTLKVSGISPASAKVTVLCHGGGCPFKSKTFAAKSGKANLIGPLKRAKLKAGSNLAILIVAPGTTGRYLSFDMRAKAIPAIKTGCSVANSLNPVGCPGPQGPQGVAGKNGAPGPAGPRGATGSAGPLITTLPAGKTLRGGWGTGQVSGGSGFVEAPITFAYPLAANVTSVIAPNANCPGTQANPQAKPGFLCIYGGSPSGIFALADGSADARYGVMVYRSASAGTFTVFYGTYAVTAP